MQPSAFQPQGTTPICPEPIRFDDSAQASINRCYGLLSTIEVSLLNLGLDELIDNKVPADIQGHLRDCVGVLEYRLGRVRENLVLLEQRLGNRV